ncbi:hypothetical protein [Aegicerativicinus sediminis]
MKRILMYFLVMPFLFMACQQESVQGNEQELLDAKKLVQPITKINLSKDLKSSDLRTRGKSGDVVQEFMSEFNTSLSKFGLMLEKIETYGAESSGRTVYFKNVGNKQLGSDFAPNDPNNVGGVMVPYWIDDSELGTSSGMSPYETFMGITNSMDTWNAVSCSQGLEIPLLGVTEGFDVGLLQYFAGFGGYQGYIPGTILFAGILPPDFFEAVLGEGAGNGTIGVTFTYIWVDDDTGEPADIDRNGKNDVAIKEIYINDNFNYQDAPNDGLDPSFVIDFQTIVLHEAGHGLSQGHFGTAFSDGRGGLHFAPHALMNAGYSVGRRTISGTDEAGHCSNWGSWPME